MRNGCKCGSLDHFIGYMFVYIAYVNKLLKYIKTSYGCECGSLDLLYWMYVCPSGVDNNEQYMNIWMGI